MQVPKMALVAFALPVVVRIARTEPLRSDWPPRAPPA